MSHTRINSISPQNSVTSSLMNMYHQYEIHINVLKWTGVIVLFIFTASTLWITGSLYLSSNMSKHNMNVSNYDINEQNLTFNQSLCSYIKHFRLPGEFMLTVCEYNKRTIIDIRQFLNNKPTIKGISLSQRQWDYLRSIIQYITRVIYHRS